MTASDIGPVAPRERIASLDVLRGVAVCGILLMNIPLMGMVWESSRPPLPAQANADWIAYTVQGLLFEGSMRGLFTLLFGAGMLIMLRSEESERGPLARDAFFTRCFALILLGMANFAVLMWPGEILTNYGIAGLALFLFRKAPIRLLLSAAAALVLIISIQFTVQGFDRADMLRDGLAAAEAKVAGKTLDDGQKKALEAREEAIKHARGDPKAAAEEVKARTSLPTLLAFSTKKWVEYNLSPISLSFAFESLAFMLLGLALYRLGVLTGERSTGFYAWLAVGGYAVGLAIRGAVSAAQWRAGFLPNPDLAIWGSLSYELGRLPVTLGLTGLIMLLFRGGLLKPIAGALSALGRLALTNYVGQSVVTSILFYGFGMLNRFSFAQLMGIAVVIWIGQAIFSVLWLKRWSMGPAEWLLRSLTYGSLRALPKAA